MARYASALPSGEKRGERAMESPGVSSTSAGPAGAGGVAASPPAAASPSTSPVTSAAYSPQGRL